ncbi:hypothetical protein ACFL1H_05835 [Nanoarchaeota archaeon]
MSILNLNGTLDSIVDKNATDKEKFVFSHIRKYYDSVDRRFPNYSYQKLSEVYGVYYDALQNDEKISLKELEQCVGICATSLGKKILKKAGLEPFFGSHQRELTSQNKKEAIVRGLNLGMPTLDIKSYLKVPYYVISNYQILTEAELDYYYLAEKWGVDLKFRNASLYYEAVDAGFTDKEIKELMVSKSIFIKDLKEDEEYYSGLVKEFLGAMFPEQEITKPYVDFEID